MNALKHKSKTCKTPIKFPTFHKKEKNTPDVSYQANGDPNSY